MQTLNLQAPKTAKMDVPVKTKGTQVAKKTPSKKSTQAKKASFKEMVDQSAKQEDGLKNKTTQSTALAQEDTAVQQAVSKTAADRTNEGIRESVSSEEHTDERQLAAVSFAQGRSVETSWLQSALETQSAQEQLSKEQAASTLIEPLGDEQIAFLKTDPLFDEGLPIQQEGASLFVTQQPPMQKGEVARVDTDGMNQQTQDRLLSENESEQLALSDDDVSWLLQEAGGSESAFFEAEVTGGKPKDKSLAAKASLSEEALQTSGDLPLVVQNASEIAVQAGEGAASAEVKAAQNELSGGVFTVTDLRPATQKGDRTAEPLADGKAQAGEGNTELTLELSLPQTTHAPSHTVLKETGGVPSFQRLLSEQLRSGAPDFVKAGSIVLRGENEGTIKLSLRPESLGNVKINLQLSDNVITGKIAVASKEAFEAFKQNIGALRQAFSDSGFEGAEFTLSYFDSSSGFAQESGGQNDGRFLSSRAYADYVSGEGGLGDTSEAQVFAFDTDKTVNVVA